MTAIAYFFLLSNAIAYLSPSCEFYELLFSPVLCTYRIWPVYLMKDKTTVCIQCSA